MSGYQYLNIALLYLLVEQKMYISIIISSVIVEQELPTLPEHLSLPLILNGVRVVQSLVRWDDNLLF
jgi:hypothetical protein